jgi:hypothetical protein
MTDLERKKLIAQALPTFADAELRSASLGLFQALGYPVGRSAPLAEKTAAYFIEHYASASSRPFNEQKARTTEWSYVDLLFQITKDDIGTQGQLFGSERVDDTIIESYLFFAIGLEKESYSRTELAAITRELNKVFPMPVFVLFRHGGSITLAVIDRRINKRDEEVDVLAKVTLIKDIRSISSHRAHVEILFDLALDSLRAKYDIRNFVDLHRAWRATLDIGELNKRFFRELSNWYFWAMGLARFPQGGEGSEDVQAATALIRLITRVIFVWFIREKNLIPESLFDRRELSVILKGFEKDEKACTFYPAILQNLFFATLNQKMHEREFALDGDFATNKAQYAVKQLYRYAHLFAIPQDEALTLFKDVPFLNGGLFDCLDNKGGKNVYVDGFSRNPAKQAFVPDYLFFGQERDADLNEVYGTSGKRYVVRGLIDILNAYKFTIAENTPIEEEVALDPELLGKVFENLLASYNPETRTTARNRTGSFYTPREIVNYMVDESLKAYLAGSLRDGVGMSEVDARAGLDILFAYTEKEHAFTAAERNALIGAIDAVKILDPACGSGAYPMGILHKLVYILHKLDPNNELWKNRQIEKAMQIDDPEIRGRTLEDIRSAFEHNELDYGRKLFLIEDCIYGADIQPIAMQIAKLRFFISLVIDQNRRPGAENLGIRALPNLETKFVAADSLIALKRNFSELFHDSALMSLEEELKKVRHAYFGARSYWEKQAYQRKDQEIRIRIVAAIKDGIERRNAGYNQQIDLLRQQLPYFEGADRQKREKKIQELSARTIDGDTADSSASLLASFDPYDQNASAPFFDPEWMFGVSGGFDVVIGNPPYIQIQNFSGKPEQARWEAQGYTAWAKTGDVYCLFYERGFKLLSDKGCLCYITSNKWMRAGYGKALRSFFLGNGGLDTVIDFGDSPIFENATTYTNILLWRRGQGESQVKAYDLSRAYSADQDLPGLLAATGQGEALFSQESFVIAAGEAAAIKRRIEAVGKPLKNWGVNINRGILTGLNEAFIIDQAKYDELVAADPKSAEILKPILRGRDIKRYRAEWAGKYLVATFPTLHLDIETYPAVRDYLKSFGKAIEQSGERGCRKKTSNKWFEVQDTIAYWAEFKKNKILWQEMAQEASFVLLKEEIYCLDTARVMTGESLKFIIAVLNSRLLDWAFSTFYAGGNLLGDTTRYKSTFMDAIPIPAISNTDKSIYEALVDCIQFARERNFDVEADTLEAVVDLMVFGLYFPEDMKHENCFINDRIADVVKPFTENDDSEFMAAYVKKLTDFCKQDAIVYQGLIQSRNVAVVRVVRGDKVS